MLVYTERLQGKDIPLKTRSRSIQLVAVLNSFGALGLNSLSADGFIGFAVGIYFLKGWAWKNQNVNAKVSNHPVNTFILYNRTCRNIIFTSQEPE